MPCLSSKSRILPASPIRKLVPYAEAAARQGVKIYHLNIGQPDIPTPQIAIDAVKGIQDKIFAYGHSAGLESYRRKLVGYYQSVGIDLTYENLIITNGGSEAIFMALSICLDEGDEVLIPEPFTPITTDLRLKPVSRSVPYLHRLKTISHCLPSRSLTAISPSNQSDPDLQPEQPDRLSLLPERVGTVAGYCTQARHVLNM